MDKKPKPKILKRITDTALYNKAIKAGCSELQALIISNRQLPSGTDVFQFMNPSLENIPNIGLLKDIHKAGNRIADAVITGEQIALACDFDVDGISSAAVLYKALTDFFGVENHKVDVCISNRMTEGYGFGDKVVERILEKDPIPSLVITADQGSSNGKQVTDFINKTKELSSKRGKKRINFIGDVIISDHHEIPKDGGPKDAYAFVNPQRKDDDFPDKTICGCTVAMFLMAATRSALIKKGYLDNNSKGIKELMAFSTAATISDCVSMASSINRAIVQQGLIEINEERTPAWKSIKALSSKNNPQDIVAESIAFGLGPMINACSRTGGDGLNAVRYYLAVSDKDAERYLSFLQVDNELRKNIEKRLVDEAVQKADALVDKGYYSLVIPIKNGHHGIHGIAASRIVERFGRPTIILSPKETEKEEIEKEEAEFLIGRQINLSKLQDFYDIPRTMEYISFEKEERNKKQTIVFYKHKITVMGGSGRSIDGLGEFQKDELNLLQCLIDSNDNYLDENKEPLFLGFGGHHMAAGMAVKMDNVIPLRKKFEDAVKEKIDESELFPKIWSDGDIPDDCIINDDFMAEIAELEPFGRKFDYPAFTIEASVSFFSDPCGKNKDTGRLKLIYKGQEYSAIWFKMILNENYTKIRIGDTYRFVVEPKYNYFNNTRTIQFSIKHFEEIT